MAQTFFYTRPQIEKIGNAIIYLASHIPDLNKTKLLKLLYLLEQISIEKYGFPFFNIRFDVWKYGPVSKDIFIELSDTPDLLKAFIVVDKLSEGTLIKAKKEFDDDEFSDNELELLAYVADNFKHTTATQLVNLTHNPHSPWYQTARINGLHEPFALGQINATNIEIDFTTLFKDTHQKAFYLENKELLAFSQHLKA
jgi:uncharacterized phage-associated protein